VLAAPQLVKAIRHASNFSLDGSEVTGRGLNGKLSELTAAVALAMLERIDDHVAVRTHAVAALLEAAERAGAPFERPRAPGQPPWQGLPLLLESAQARERALRELHAAGVEARPYYAPGLHRTQAFAGCAAGPLSATEAICDRILCLPVYSRIEPDELELLTGALHAALVGAGAREHGLSRR
jgi:dTDP-4-amino-4,6-dideoxygalactose transaminase